MTWRVVVRWMHGWLMPTNSCGDPDHLLWAFAPQNADAAEFVSFVFTCEVVGDKASAARELLKQEAAAKAAFKHVRGFR